MTKHNDRQIKTEARKLVTQEQEKTKAKVLSDTQVKEFLTQYFTKDKLGENNSRIKPYMTDSAYSEEETRQGESLNQVYKDYMLDYRFEAAAIFVNKETNEALAEVSYQVVYVSDLSDKAQHVTQTETKTVKLSYAKLSDKLLVNQLTIWNGKLDELKENNDVTNSAIPEINSSTTISSN
ncbi:hypothetical protein STRIC_1208 [Streptococcus ictaluri 707-05]|uniref:Parvulin-like peptidyl-prolyl isomerase n=1 Tax=Streptococcus ictaluri 707-05 TaxID=764299 RepID=G5K340_9STRE|nr:hypothetical protein STRIC_1208 [Streptococcus ictaluri 707-05]